MNCSEKWANLKGSSIGSNGGISRAAYTIHAYYVVYCFIISNDDNDFSNLLLRLAIAVFAIDIDTENKHTHTL